MLLDQVSYLTLFWNMLAHVLFYKKGCECLPHPSLLYLVVGLFSLEGGKMFLFPQNSWAWAERNSTLGSPSRIHGEKMIQCGRWERHQSLQNVALCRETLVSHKSESHCTLMFFFVCLFF